MEAGGVGNAVLPEILQQGAFRRGEGEQRALGGGAALPGAHHYVGHGDVLIGHTQIGAQGGAFFAHEYGTCGAAGDGGAIYHGSPFAKEGCDVDFHFRCTVAAGCGLNHIDVLLGAYAGYGAVVFYAYEETAAVVVGEGGYGAGYLAGIGNLEFEVLMLVFPLVDEALYVVAPLYCLYILHLGVFTYSFYSG